MTATQPRPHQTAPPKWDYITDDFAPSAGRPPPAAYGVLQLSPPQDVETLRADRPRCDFRDQRQYPTQDGCERLWR